MESWEITSEQITASSQYNPSWSPERSRLNYPENGWTPSDDTVREWIQVSGCSPTSALVNNGRTPRGLLISESELSFSWFLLRSLSAAARMLPSRDAAHIWPEYCSTHLFDFSANHGGLAERKSNKPACNFNVTFLPRHIFFFLFFFFL